MIESGQRDLVDRILVVTAKDTVRIHRVHARDGRSEQQIRAIMHGQADDDARNAAADDELDNNGTLEDLLPRVQQLHQQYMSLSAHLNFM